MWCLSRNSMPSMPWQPSGAEAIASPVDLCPGTAEERTGLLKALHWGHWWRIPAPWTRLCKLCLLAMLCRAAVGQIGRSKVVALALLQEVFCNVSSVCPQQESSRTPEITTSSSPARIYSHASQFMEKPLYKPSKISPTDPFAALCSWNQLWCLVNSLLVEAQKLTVNI